MRRALLLVLPAALLLLVAVAASSGCSDEEAGPSPSSGPAIPPTVFATIGPAGGAVSTEGVTIVIPPGALATEVPIGVSAAGGAPDRFLGLSQLYSFVPHGTTFLVPARVTFSILPGSVDPVVYWSKPEGGYERLGGTEQGGRITAGVMHFSVGFVATELDGGADADADADAADATDAADTIDAADATGE